MRCTDLLIEDHKAILRALDVMDCMARRIEKGQDVERQDVETLLLFLRAFADDHHQLKEESALFPELIRSCSTEQQGLKKMLFEHDQERSLVEALEDALRTKKPGEFVHFADRFLTLIRSHIYKEDHILFDIVQRLLSPEQDESVCSALAKFEIKIEWLNDLDRLEAKYVQKAAWAHQTNRTSQPFLM